MIRLATTIIHEWQLVASDCEREASNPQTNETLTSDVREQQP
jgi:hypothetical protein